MAGRTVPRFVRAYMNEFDLSGFSRTVGPLVWTYPPADLTAQMGDAVKGFLPGQPTISPGTLNAVYDNTATTGLQAVMDAANGSSPGEIVTVAVGDKAAPILGVPVFAGQFPLLSFLPQPDGEAVTATGEFGQSDVANLINYHIPWGHLLHPLGAETGVNSAVGMDGLASTSLGGYMVYHVTASNGTATIKVQDAAANNDGAFGDLAGATSGVVDFSSGGKGIVQLGVTATVKQYLRWQVALGTATTLTFVLSFVRGIH